MQHATHGGPTNLTRIRVLGAASVVNDKGDELLSLSGQPKRLALLIYLILARARGDGFVSRHILHALFWPESDQDRARNNLNQHVFQLRTTLGADAIVSRGQDRLAIDPAGLWVDALAFHEAVAAGDSARAVELYQGELLPGLHVHGASAEWEHWLEGKRRWYRDAASDAVRTVDRVAPDRRIPDRDPTVGSGTVPQPGTRATPTTRPGWERWAAIAIVALIVAAAVGRYARTPPTDTPLLLAEAGAMPRLLVLPPGNLTGDTTVRYLIDGLHAALIGESGQLRGVEVLSRHSALTLSTEQASLASIAERVNADLVLETDVRLLGDSVEAQFRLLDARTEHPRWQAAYRTSRAHLVELVDRVPRTVAPAILRTVHPGTTPAARSPRIIDPAAVEAYLRGEYHGRQWGQDSLALAFFDEALHIEPGYAAAHAARGRVLHNQGGWFGRRPPVDVMPEAILSLERALALDSTLPEAHLLMANIRFIFLRDWTVADREYRRAIELNPSLASARNHYANFLRAMRRVDEGVRQLERAVALDPLDVGSWAELAAHYTHLGRIADARAAAARAREIAPESAAARLTWGLRLFEQGQPDAAVATLDSARLEPFATMILAAVGQVDAARRRLAALEGAARPNSLVIAMIHAALGDTAAALDWIERGYRTRDPNLVWLGFATKGVGVDGYHPIARGWPTFTLADHPRVIAVLDEMGFPEPPHRGGDSLGR